MKQIKTDFHSRMSSATLTMLMRIMVESPDIQCFNPLQAIDLWDSGTPSGGLTPYLIGKEIRKLKLALTLRTCLMPAVTMNVKMKPCRMDLVIKKMKNVIPVVNSDK